ncbi:Methyltransferase small domain-containing protein [Pseudoxanthomonas sp. CF385]|uniref:methyltransferase n=1 Tax=Pseudoxanthomonas sp. CF385 TaxID=1881042 RepID=UPI00088E40D6|nr:methyltransferase [Pseudoxanthomonas sp. CF385]SDQ29871.1 Methyltransferase small domain-containing protein [Pseudoxanthomonas sp. CF385]
MNFDYYPTPPHLAKELVELVAVDEPKLVADFSAGSGNLLVSAAARWPHADITAIDIQREFTDALKRTYPSWQIGTCNFLSSNSSKSCKALKGIKGRVDVVLLNPPFSRASTEGVFVLPCGTEISCSPALKFVLESQRYLSSKGEISTVLPISALYGSRDADARAYLSENWSLKINRVVGRRTFRNCFVETALVNVRAKVPEPRSPTTLEVVNMERSLTIKRGRVHVHSAVPSKSKKAVEFLHTTNLKHNKVLHSSFRSPSVPSTLSGPAVVIPRVGRPDRRKICIIGAQRKFVMSDCLIALVPSPPFSTRELQQLLIDNFSDISATYVGTGAPFTTIERLRDALRRLGIESI